MPADGELVRDVSTSASQSSSSSSSTPPALMLSQSTFGGGLATAEEDQDSRNAAAEDQRRLQRQRRRLQETAARVHDGDGGDMDSVELPFRFTLPRRRTGSLFGDDQDDALGEGHPQKNSEGFSSADAVASALPSPAIFGLPMNTASTTTARPTAAGATLSDLPAFAVSSASFAAATTASTANPASSASSNSTAVALTSPIPLHGAAAASTGLIMGHRPHSSEDTLASLQAAVAAFPAELPDPSRDSLSTALVTAPATFSLFGPTHESLTSPLSSSSAGGAAVDSRNSTLATLGSVGNGGFPLHLEGGGGGPSDPEASAVGEHLLGELRSENSRLQTEVQELRRQYQAHTEHVELLQGLTENNLRELSALRESLDHTVQFVKLLEPRLRAQEQEVEVIRLRRVPEFRDMQKQLSRLQRGLDADGSLAGGRGVGGATGGGAGGLGGAGGSSTLERVGSQLLSSFLTGLLLLLAPILWAWGAVRKVANRKSLLQLITGGGGGGRGNGGGGGSVEDVTSGSGNFSRRSRSSQRNGSGGSGRRLRPPTTSSASAATRLLSGGAGGDPRSSPGGRSSRSRETSTWRRSRSRSRSASPSNQRRVRTTTHPSSATAAAAGRRSTPAVASLRHQPTTRRPNQHQTAPSDSRNWVDMAEEYDEDDGSHYEDDHDHDDYSAESGDDTRAPPPGVRTLRGRRFR